MKKQTNKHSKRHVTSVVCDWVSVFYFLQSESSVWSDIRGIRKRHLFSYAVQLIWIDLWLIHSAAWHVSYLFNLSYFLRWNLVSCVYIERISYGRCFFSNRRALLFQLALASQKNPLWPLWCWAVKISPIRSSPFPFRTPAPRESLLAG